MIYLASPCSHPDPAVREQRYQAACRAVAALLHERRLVFSPIVNGHPLGETASPATGPSGRISTGRTCSVAKR